MLHALSHLLSVISVSVVWSQTHVREALRKLVMDDNQITTLEALKGTLILLHVNDLLLLDAFIT